jgi:hypothetical protein
MKKLFFVFLMILIPLFAQDTTIIMPGYLNIKPFTAYILEPRMGFVFKTNVNELRLDIGASRDLLWYKPDWNQTYSFGVDFFTYSLLRKEKDFHFPVDAIDYLFGVNFGYKNDNTNESGVRFRISHISTHMVDGHIDNYRNYDSTKPLTWRNGIPAKVYSREFFELIYYYFLHNLRVYGGMTYVFHIDPSYLGDKLFHFGFDYYFKDLITKNIHLYVAHNLKIHKVNAWKGDNNFQLGIKFGKLNENNFSISWCYYKGLNFHGQYYKYNDEYNGININFNF